MKRDPDAYSHVSLFAERAQRAALQLFSGAGMATSTDRRADLFAEMLLGTPLLRSLPGDQDFTNSSKPARKCSEDALYIVAGLNMSLPAADLGSFPAPAKGGGHTVDSYLTHYRGVTCRSQKTATLQIRRCRCN